MMRRGSMWKDASDGQDVQLLGCSEEAVLERGGEEGEGERNA